MKLSMWKTAVLLLLLTGFGLSACNTMQGVGRDVQRSGEAIEDTAREVM